MAGPAKEKLGKKTGRCVEHSEDAALFRLDNLLRFKAVAFVNTTGDILDEEQQRAFEAFIGAGGGYLGVHSAADTEYDWPWYGELVGAWFKSHPPGLHTGTVRFARPLGGSWPVAWRVTDEFYNYRNRPSAEVTVISALDESTYEGAKCAEHPIAWCRRASLVHGARTSARVVRRRDLSRPPRKRSALCSL